MKSYIRLIANHLSCCLNCGSLLVSDGLLCRFCKNRIDPFKRVQTEVAPPLTVRSHFHWRPGESNILSKLVLSLKGGGQKRAWDFYAREFVREVVESLPSYRRICVVPAPGRDAQAKDHAFLWGRALAEAMGAEFVPCLTKVSSGSQRLRDRGERTLIEMEAHVNSTSGVDFSTQCLWIFADDILTTGATAREAYRALGSPPHFEVWVLAHRGLSCGASKDLLYSPHV